MSSWFIKTGASLLGPLSATEVESALKDNRVRWIDLAIEAGADHWRPLVAIREFQALRDGDSRARGRSVRAVDGGLKGPFADDELMERVRAGIISYDDCVETDQGWRRIGDIPDLASRKGSVGTNPQITNAKAASDEDPLSSIVIRKTSQDRGVVRDERPPEADGQDLVDRPSWLEFV